MAWFGRIFKAHPVPTPCFFIKVILKIIHSMIFVLLGNCDYSVILLSLVGVREIIMVTVSLLILQAARINPDFSLTNY